MPFYLSHTVVAAEGDDRVTGVTIGEVDADWKVVPGTEKYFDVDTICVAVGLSPMSQLLSMSGCDMVDDPKRGGCVPVCDEKGATSVPGVYVSGDVAGIEEASSAMIEGRISGVAIAEYLGYTDAADAGESEDKLEASLDTLRQGMFAPKNRGKTIEATEEGCPVSQHLLCHGYLDDDELNRYPGVTHMVGVHPVIECTQNIPCNPCQDACKKGCISIGEHITSLPIVVEDSHCIDCGMCVASCPGQSIFLVNEDCGDGTATVTLPYEFYPLPQVGDCGCALSRSGEPVCDAQVARVRNVKAFDKTALVTMSVPKEFAMAARMFKPAKDAEEVACHE